MPRCLLRLAALILLAIPGPASAAERVVLSLLTNRTGPAAAVGRQVADGMYDYLEMLNQRDGGVGGVPLAISECEVASDAGRGRACYEAAREAGAVLVVPPDRVVTNALLAPAIRDRIPLLSLADGFPAGTLGDVLPWAFNPSASVLGGITIAIRYLADRLGGNTELKGLSIGLAYSEVGADPPALALLRNLSRAYGFATPLFPLDDATPETDVWKRIVRNRPDFLILLGQGVHDGVAIEDILASGYPPERLIALRWPDEATIRKAGSAGRGIKEVSRHAFGDAFPLFDEIDRYVVDTGLSRTPKDGAGATHYNRGVYNGVLIGEAIRVALKRRTGGALTGGDIRRSLEGLVVDDGRWKELGLSGFARGLTLTCADHGGHPDGFVQVWDGAKWLRATGPLPQMVDVIRERLDAVAADFRAANPGWPPRTEACDAPT